MKTSDSDPIRVDFLPGEALGLQGRIGMTISPGKKLPGLAGLWRRHLEKDLQRLREHYGADLLVSLLEPNEFEKLGTPDLLARARAYGMETAWLPTPDGSVPDSINAFRELIERILDSARQGQTVIIHCRGGLGRTGLVAASCLVALGHAPSQAVQVVRRVRPGSVENRKQEEYVRAFSLGRL